MEILGRISPARVLVGAVVWVLFFVQLAVLLQVFPTDVPGCSSTAFFGCTDWTALFVQVASVPVWYVVWWRLLRRFGGRLAALGPVAVTVLAFVGFQAFEPSTVPGSLARLVLCYLLPAILWDLVAGERETREVSSEPSAPADRPA